MRGTPIPIHRSLTEDILLGGVPREMAIVNGALGAGLGIGGHSWYVIPVFIFIHMGLAYVHKNDSQFLLCLRSYFHLKNYYGT